jgi:ABC1 atypical kinase-like domain
MNFVVTKCVISYRKNGKSQVTGKVALFCSSFPRLLLLLYRYSIIYILVKVLAFGNVESSHKSTSQYIQRPWRVAKRSLQFFRQKVSVRTNHQFRADNDGIQYPWRRPPPNRNQLHQASFVLQSATKLLALLPDKRYLLTGIATFYVVHKVRTSEPMQRSIYFWTHAGPIVFHYKFTQWWLSTVKYPNNIEKRHTIYEKLHNQYAPATYKIILHLRGLYVKMGQILSSRPDFMPIQYIQYFTKLQDSIPAVDTDIIQAFAIDELQKHCPTAYTNYESITFDPIPLGSASIGQVHRAILHRRMNNISISKSIDVPASQEVAIKVMHQNAKQKFQMDFQVFRWLCRIAIPSWCTLLHALERQVMKEFDYSNEAQSLQTVRDSIMNAPKKHQYYHRVCIPQPIHELCCEHVLVMEMLHGKKLTDSIRDKLVEAFHGNVEQVNEFLQQRQKEVLIGTIGSRSDDNNITSSLRTSKKVPSRSNEILHDSVNFLGKLKLLLLLRQCRNTIDLLVDVHGYQIFHSGMLRKVIFNLLFFATS